MFLAGAIPRWARALVLVLTLAITGQVTLPKSELPGTSVGPLAGSSRAHGEGFP